MMEFTSDKKRLPTCTSENHLQAPRVASAWDPQRNDCACTVSIVAIGDLGVGKTSILHRFVEDRFINGYQPTIGVDFLERVVDCDSVPVNVVLIDTAGQERYHSLTQSFYRSASGVMVVFDQSREDTFVSVADWVRQVREATRSPDLPCLLVGNKRDLPADERVVASERARELAGALGMTYVQTSAATGDGIAAAVLWLVTDVVQTEDASADADARSAVCLGDEPAKRSKLTGDVAGGGPASRGKWPSCGC